MKQQLFEQIVQYKVLWVCPATDLMLSSQNFARNGSDTGAAPYQVILTIVSSVVRGIRRALRNWTPGSFFQNKTENKIAVKEYMETTDEQLCSRRAYIQDAWSIMQMDYCHVAAVLPKHSCTDVIYTTCPSLWSNRVNGQSTYNALAQLATTPLVRTYPGST